MADIEQVKKLREKTGVSIGVVKKALEEAGGDVERAEEILQSRGVEIAERKAGRETKAGVIDEYIHGDGTIGVLVELLCETDFVARNGQFRALAHDLAMQIAATDPADEKELLESPFIKDESKTVADHIQEAVAVLGENITIGRFCRIAL